ncbi:MAG: helical backbone metal receptor [Elusimicrobiota bacterium]|jgi:iron complex transport system substrate-binding protein|nr:helical backbone metal receptor [Elusimicrobiota bacterium]
MKKLLLLIFILLTISGVFIYKYKTPEQKSLQSGGIISLMPSNTEILFELGAKNITAVSNFCNWPPQTKNIKKIGDSFAADTEAIIAMKPKMVYLNEDARDLKMRLDNLNIPNHAITNAKSIQDIYDNINLIASLENLNPAPLLLELKNYAAQKPQHKVKAFVEVDGGLWTIGKESFINDIIEYAGAENIFKDVPTSYFQTTLEAVLRKTPDIIISIKLKSKEEDFLPQQLRNKKIIRLDPDIYARPAPRVIRSIPNLKTQL